VPPSGTLALRFSQVNTWISENLSPKMAHFKTLVLYYGPSASLVAFSCIYNVGRKAFGLDVCNDFTLIFHFQGI